MIRFSVCLETIFNSLPLAERIDQAAACGAHAVEFWTWKDKDLDTLTHAKETAGVNIASFTALNDVPPNHPAQSGAALSELLQGLEVARQLGAAALTIQCGMELDNVSRADQLDSVAGLLDAAAAKAQKAHVLLLVEPLNAGAEHPGSLLSKTADAAAIIDKVGQPNVKILFDIYEQYTTEGSVLHSIESNIGRIGHFHVADVPGRGQPGSGGVDFREIFKLIDSLGYGGYVGLEFYPTGDHTTALKETIALA